jgi:prepilin-type N-terminal cleavage/methylation domain-containing protein
LKNHLRKGFTLIELLVVISIVSMLSSVVLASVNTARIKAQNARIVEETVSLRNQIELSFNGSAYAGIPIAPPIGGAVTGIVAPYTFSGSVATQLDTILTRNSGTYGGGVSNTLTSPCGAGNINIYNVSIGADTVYDPGHATNGLTVYTYPACVPPTKYAIYSMYTPIKIAMNSWINTAYAVTGGDDPTKFSGYYCVDSTGHAIFKSGWIPAKITDGECH